MRLQEMRRLQTTIDTRTVEAYYVPRCRKLDQNKITWISNKAFSSLPALQWL